jgi:hypothetical protein
LFILLTNKNRFSPALFIGLLLSKVAKPGDGMTNVEARSMFTMWAALPGPLMLSADLRPAAGNLNPFVMETLTNTEVIAVNQVRCRVCRCCTEFAGGRINILVIIIIIIYHHASFRLCC